MMTGVLAPIAILGTIALIVVLFLQRGRDMDLSPRSVLRLYLYIASLAGVVVLAIGLASTVNFSIAGIAGDPLIYGGPGPIPARPACPPGKECPEQSAEERERYERQQLQERERRRNEDLIRGLTFAVFGGVFWGAHWAARRGLGEAEPSMLGLRRGYLMLGTIVFGLATIILLPTGIYQVLSTALLPAPEGYFRPGADALGGGLVSLPLWLLYLRLVVREFRQVPA
jgi:hypothetical protein